MKAVIYRAHPLLQDVRVDLRRGEVGVAEHHLDGAQVRAAFEQMRGEGVPQHVRTERRRDARAQLPPGQPLG